MKKALITGITGQDGSYLAELLLGKGTRFTELRDAHPRSILRKLIIFIRSSVSKASVHLHYGDCLTRQVWYVFLNRFDRMRSTILVLSPMWLYLLMRQSTLRM